MGVWARLWACAPPPQTTIQPEDARPLRLLSPRPPGKNRAPYPVGATADRRPGTGSPRAAARTARRSGRTYVHGRGALSSPHNSTSGTQLPVPQDRHLDASVELAAASGRAPQLPCLQTPPTGPCLKSSLRSSLTQLCEVRGLGLASQALPPAATPHYPPGLGVLPCPWSWGHLASSSFPITEWDLRPGLGQDQLDF